MDDDSITPTVSDGPNRRDLLKGAAGIAAAATVGGLLIGPPFASAATAAPGLWCSIPNLVAGPNTPFEVLSMTWSGTSAAGTGSGGGGVVAKAALSAVTLTKYADANSTALVRAMLTGAPIASATLTYANNSSVVQQVFELTGVRVSSFGTQNGGGEPFYEEFELEYAKISIAMPGSTTVTYDRTNNTVS